MFQSTDSGGSWIQFLAGNYVGALAIDPQSPSALYAAQGIYGFYTETAKVFQSSDRGKTWSEADSGIPVMTLFGDIPSSMLAIHTLVVDPHASGQVYAGTLAGVFRTKDGGTSWTSVNDGLTKDCCGCLVPRVEGDQVRLVCNECGAVAAVITREQFEAGYVPEELRFEEGAQCPRCGALNSFPGFSAIEAFVCQECGEGVTIERPIQ